MGPCGKGWTGVPPGAASGGSTEMVTGSSNRSMSPVPFPACTRAACRWYTSHYCEENTLRLCRDLIGPAEATGVELYVVFISNRARQVPVWCQSLADSEYEPVLWDYHVLLMAQHPCGNWIYDLDSTLPFPSQATQYMTHAFRKGASMDERYRQVFRVVPARECADHFASDRSHMRQRGGVYSAQPPEYPPMRGPRASSSNNMEEWINMDASVGRGRVLSLLQMEAFVGSAPYRYT